MSTASLEGVRVLDLSRLLPGPFLTMVLADMGADVVKIEAPVIGDYLRQMPPLKGKMSGRFLAINRNKRSLELNLKTEAGRDALLAMAAKADVVVESFRPGVMDKLGIGYDKLKEVNDKIILCSISGFGQTGPYAKRAGHDLNYISLAGTLAMTGAAGGSPVMPGVQVADLAGGALWGATAVLGALVGRDKIGGQHLDISMTEGALTLLATEMGNLDCTDEVPSRGNGGLNGALACYGVYECKDGRYYSVAALEPKFWAAFNTAVGRKVDVSEVIAPPERQATIRQEIRDIMLTKTRDEWTEILGKVDCCSEPVLELDELQDHPLHKERGLFFHAEGDDEGVVQVRTPVGQPSAKTLGPTLGEHSREVLEEYGFGAEQIAALLPS